MEAILRAAQIAQTAPRGPGVRESRRRAAGGEARRAARPCPTSRATPRRRGAPRARSSSAAAAALLSGAKSPLMLAGRCSRSLERLERARRAGREARHAGAHQHQAGRGFPTDHRLHAAARGPPDARGDERSADADVILALDWLRSRRHAQAGVRRERVAAKVIKCRATLTATAAGAWTTRACRRRRLSDVRGRRGRALLLEAVARAGRARLARCAAAGAARRTASRCAASRRAQGATRGIDVSVHARASRVERRAIATSVIRSTTSAATAAAAWAPGPA